MLLFVLFRNFSNVGVFFFLKKKKQKAYFFFQEKFKIYSLTQIQKARKKIRHWKKKHNFHSLTRFLTKNGKS